MLNTSADLTNKTVVITGGASRKETTEELLSSGIAASYEVFDVTKLAGVEQLANKAWADFGRVDLTSRQTHQ